MCGNGRSCRNKRITTTPNTFNKAFGTILFWLSCKILTFLSPESIVKSIVWRIKGDIKGGWVDRWPVSTGLSWACESPPPTVCPLPTSAPLSESDFKSHESCAWTRTAVYRCTIEFYSSASNGHQCLNNQLSLYCAVTFFVPSPSFLKLSFVSFGNTKHNVLSQFINGERNL